MRKEELKLRFSIYLSECRRHLDIVKKGFEKIDEFLPLSNERIDVLLDSSEQVALLDQIAYRFIKFQDTLGKLLKYYFLKEGESLSEMTMLDMINYAERLGFPIDEDFWMELRVLRNSITHDYPDTYNEVVQALNRLNEILPVLDDCLDFFER